MTTAKYVCLLTLIYGVVLMGAVNARAADEAVAPRPIRRASTS
jgi:hypothetical protein